MKSGVDVLSHDELESERRGVCNDLNYLHALSLGQIRNAALCPR